MKFGVLYSYWGNEWKCDYIETAGKIHKAGFDIMEVGAGHLLEMSELQLRELKNTCDELGLQITANIGPSKDKDVASPDPAVRQAGITYLTDIMKNMAKIGAKKIVGVMYTYWPNDFSDPDKDAIWNRGVESMRKMAETAEELDIEMCLEVVNRFETHILNTCEEGIRFCREVGSPNVKLLLDTFHMNIEEDNIAEAVRSAGNYLGELHAGEGNRRLPGQGSLPWREIGKALRETGYEGGVVMEPFVKMGGQVGKDIKVWRDLSKGADEERLSSELAESLVFLKNSFCM
ncbi:sugar phosphate isomerase/epimerase family protein [uncultured Robinsoniella sp.]|uniref:D-psicose 3-epimerase n=1 Tax=uncultured Robinsoniella sp. TaxID=904190 RepID=UPI00374ECB40